MNNQSYNICKDNSPEKTILNIKNILKKYNIQTEETILKRLDNSNEVSSVRISLSGFSNAQIGTNGKGLNKINALASGYSEFLERLQTRILIKFSGDCYTFEPDEIIVDNENVIIDSILKSSLKSKSLKKYNHIMNIFNAREFLFCKSNETGKYNFNNIKNKTFQVPFISVKKQTKKLIPISLLYCTQASTGMAAGNTYEEAIVQALSEICERYCMYNILKKGLTLPSIPLKIYSKYSKLVQLKNYIEKQGIKVTVKDASLGLGFPVICTIFEDKTNNKTFSLSFGSHPYLPIAIERTFTEFLQGYDISDNNIRKNEVIFAKNSPKDIEEITNEISTQRTTLDKTSKIYLALAKKKESYKFDVKTWDFEENTNNYFMKKLINIIFNISEDIYIRDYSFLGFPTIYIYVPKMSDIINSANKQKYLHLKNINVEKWLEFIYFNGEAGTIEELYVLSKYITISAIPAPLVSLYCSIILKNRLQIRKSIRLAKKSLKYESRYYKIVQIIEEYYNLYLKNYSNDKIEDILSSKFDRNYCKKIILFISNLNYNALLQILKNNPRCETNINNKYDFEKLNELKSKLHILYKENMPSQDNIIEMLRKNYRINQAVEK